MAQIVLHGTLHVTIYEVDKIHVSGGGRNIFKKIVGNIQETVGFETFFKLDELMSAVEELLTGEWKLNNGRDFSRRQESHKWLAPKSMLKLHIFGMLLQDVTGSRMVLKVEVFARVPTRSWCTQDKIGRLAHQNLLSRDSEAKARCDVI
ncbi:hypothetical protein Tco_1045319 [Tanacetum coccineum]|uniref:Uncharacterized protein n=1 Tax=Tanacetum coccineum TaxID=301880 RepID=A0ABQ5GSY7_9ASTR